MPYPLNQAGYALNDTLLGALPAQFGTPLWIYDAGVISRQIDTLRQFDTIRFAQKACSNLHILRLMRQAGVRVDAVSLGRSNAPCWRVSSRGDEIVFTADVIDEATLDRVCALAIPVNAGSCDMLRQLGEHAPGHPVWLRINPGFGHGHSQKTNTGGENSKHGIWHQDLDQALALIDAYDLRLVGLHMHIGSGVDYDHLARVCDTLANQAIALGRDIQAISAGGGLSIPYRADEQSVDVTHYFGLWDAARRRIAAHLGHPVRLEIEPGRYLVAQSGLLMAEVRAVKTMGQRHFVLADAGFNDLMRPAMYGSHHHISLLARDGRALSGPLIETVVGGPLCESGDVFTQREGGTVTACALPAAQVGDWLVFHDTGAYGASMSSNYNSRPLLPEVLVTEQGVTLIRRRQRMEELFALEQL
ncbi:diaminopimelate decarboxylase [Edwardsiella tarda]|uniref:diaminopimelate decarboxylase n=1 Tax=Edwardsiella tarda TaxID=636 RepID=UPI00351CB09F